MAVCPSLKVVNFCARATGSVLLRGMSFPVRPPMVSRPATVESRRAAANHRPAVRLPASNSPALPRRATTRIKIVQRRAGHARQRRVDIEHARCAAHHDHAAMHLESFGLRERFIHSTRMVLSTDVCSFQKLRLTEASDHMTVG